MKKVFLILIIAGFGFYQWLYYIPEPHYYSSSTPAYPIHTNNKTHIEETTKHTASKSLPSFHCDGRQHCSQMHSYEEAKFFLDHCPDPKMDGDKDGIPCERQFGKH
jgi:hypothetical protein